MPVPRKPAAFMSYVRFDDQHESGQLSRFRDLLSAEVRVQTGEEFPIFQDRNDIDWGQNWRARIEEALDEVTLLIPIITPSFFRSPACRTEVTQFLERERQLDREDLILPVYYVSAPEIDDLDRRETDPLARVLAARQYADWRELRFEPFTSSVVRKALAHLASRMRDPFWQQPPTRRARPRSPSRPPAEGAASEPVVARPASVGQPISTAKREPETHIVEAEGRGEYATIGDAIRDARPGDRILVRPGLYQEGLLIDKPLEVLGDGPAKDIVIRARGQGVLTFRANIGRVAHLTLRHESGQRRWYGVDITQGRLELEGCDISSDSLTCVAIRDGADPRLRQNRIHDGSTGTGIFVDRNGLGTLEDNELSGHAYAGVSIRGGGNPTLRRNQIRSNKQAGVLVYDGGLGRLEDNDISHNVLSGVEIKSGGNPTLRRNQIHDNKQSGIYVQEGGLGTLEDNDISENELVGVSITTTGNPTLRNNRINRNRHEAVWIRGDGRATIEDNDLTGNGGNGPWRIAADCLPRVQRDRNRT
jgi:parallel beta-helix repeat protein